MRQAHAQGSIAATTSGALLTACSALAFAISFTARAGGPWTAQDFSQLADALWKVPAGTIAIVLLPPVSAIIARWLDSLRPERTQGRRSSSASTLAALAGLVFWGGAAMVWLIAPVTAHIIMVLVAWCMLRGVSVLAARAHARGSAITESVDGIAFLFFASGFSALIYQIVWQRTLYAMFGVDIESVTIIVSVFMFGLGIGAIAGTLLLQINRHLLATFIAVEFGIGAFGWFSLDLAAQLQNRLVGDSHWVLLAASYALFAIPTLLMGATLPLLVGYLNQRYRNIGRSTGLLYAVNTWGSALAALLTVTVIFVFSGLRGATWIAAAMNFATALGALLLAPRLKPHAPDTGAPPVKSRLSLAYPSALLLAFLVGFLALSQELIWFRLLGLATGGNPRLFGIMLAMILLGIGCGSFNLKRACEHGTDPSALVCRLLILAAVLSFFSLPIVAVASAMSSRGFGALIGFALCGVIACCTGGILPLLATMGNHGDPGREARQAGWVIAANIAGAAFGPLLTGYVLFNFLPLEQLSALSAAGLLALAPFFSNDRKLAYARCFALLIGGAVLFGPFNWLALERVQNETFSPAPFSHRIENRSSVVVSVRSAGGDVIYGGGVYDGRINTDPTRDTNGIKRAYMVAALHREPRHVLEIGLSGGSWAAVISSHGKLEQLTSVEINPGYLQLIADYREVAPVLQHPRVRITIDDGRRWLRRHRDRKFDVIVMNMTFHWRANATNLLSLEFMQVARSHLNPGGVFYFNTTHSEHAVFTAAQVFRHVSFLGGFVAASDAPFDMSVEERRNNLMRHLPGPPETAGTTRADLAAFLSRLAERPVPDVAAAYRARTDLRVITDDNLLTEFKL